MVDSLVADPPRSNSTPRGPRQNWTIQDHPLNMNIPFKLTMKFQSKFQLISLSFRHGRVSEIVYGRSGLDYFINILNRLDWVFFFFHQLMFYSYQTKRQQFNSIIWSPKVPVKVVTISCQCISRTRDLLTILAYKVLHNPVQSSLPAGLHLQM